MSSASPQQLEELLRRQSEKASGNPDLASQNEARVLGADDRRKEHLKDTFHLLFIWTLRIAFFGLVCIGLVRGWHLIAPEGYCWLNETRVQSIDKILFSASLGGLMGRYLNQIVPK